jgi:formylmethanofuran dehydrogenase subunit E
MDEELTKIKEFHGHLGPYAVIGYRMGLIAKEKLKGCPFSLNAIVFTKKTPPMSCVIDGIQISSGCTLGKGNISVNESDDVKAEFTGKDGQFLEIFLKPEIKKGIETEVNEENMISYSETLFEKPDFELFEIKN